MRKRWVTSVIIGDRGKLWEEIYTANDTTNADDSKPHSPNEGRNLQIMIPKVSAILLGHMLVHGGGAPCRCRSPGLLWGALNAAYCVDVALWLLCVSVNCPLQRG